MARYFFNSITAAAVLSMAAELPRNDYVVNASTAPEPKPTVFLPRKQQGWKQSRQEQRNREHRESQRMKAMSWQRY